MKNLVFFIDENIPFLFDIYSPDVTVIKFKGRYLSNRDLKNNKCNALICRSTTFVNDELLNGTPVSFVATATSGIDHIDLNYLKKNNISFSYAPGSNANSVAEYVLFSILHWKKINNINLENKNFGVIGFGNIGKIVAKYAHFVGMKVFINDPPLNDLHIKFPEYVIHKDIEEIFQISDIITNHVPLTHSAPYPTKYLINDNLISLIKKNALFIHTSRGKVADEQALIKEIKAKNITAVIDVWENEPSINQDLVNLSFISTPHIAGYSFDGKLKGALMIANSVNKYFGINSNTDRIKQILDNNSLFDEKIFKNHNELYRILNDKRQILSDSINLKRIVGLPSNLRDNYFDELRKNYPVRRESLIVK